MKILPSYNHYWVRLRDLAPGVTEEDVQELIASRIGVTISLERISVRDNGDRQSGIVALTPENLRDFMRWAFSGDSLQGRPLQFSAPAPQRDQHGHQ